MKKHTQGKWVASRGSRRVDVIDYISIGAGFASLTRGIGQTNAEITANARLIELAPDLLDAISELVDAYDNAEETKEFSSKLAKAREVISKI
jgi:hypothetical protein